MNKNIRNVLAVGSIALLLTACGGKTNEVKNEPAKNNKANAETTVENNKKTDSSVGKVDESEFGRVEVIKEKKNINDQFESGPIKLTITDIQISKVNPSPNYKSMFNDKDEVTSVVLAVEVENTSDETINFFPDQGTIVTNTKEQKGAQVFLSDEVGGDFIGQVKKKGNIIFILDSNAEEINNVKFVLGNASNSNFENVGEEITASYDI
ncbi:MAG: hypothetical protein E6214_00255 [Peptoniphilus harei]|nr:hypothetical protein [Peptoniphilus harei]